MEIILMITCTAASAAWWGHTLLKDPAEPEQRWGKRFIYGGAIINLAIGATLVILY